MFRQRRLSGIHYVGNGYFETMGIPLLRGSDLPANDGPGATTDIVVNEAIVQQYWPDQDPIGKRIRYSLSYEPDGVGPWYRVVGVVGNVKYRSLQRSDSPDMYLSFLNPEASLWSMAFVARASQDPGSVAAAMRQAAWDLDPSLPLATVRSMEEHVAESITSPRFFAWLFATFATIALVLASVGIYGAMTYSVGQRISELGLRKALGAGNGDVVRLVIRQGLGVVTVGLALGLVGTLGLSRVLTSFLFGVTPTDPVTLIFVVITLGTVAVAACYVPSRRAAMVDPMTTLRRV